MFKPRTRIRVYDNISRCGVRGTVKVVCPAGDFTTYGVLLDDGRYTTVLHVSFLQSITDVLIPYKDGKAIRMTVI